MNITGIWDFYVTLYHLMKINIINKVMKFIGGDRYFGCCFKTGMQNNHVFRKSTKEKYCLIKMYDKI